MPADVIDYRLIGDDLQAVIVTLDPGEGVIAEAGAMMYMEDGIEMATTLDPTGAGGGLMSKLLGAGKRMLTGESFFITLFANQAHRRRDVAFSSPYPGKIQPIDLKDWGGHDHRAEGCVSLRRARDRRQHCTESPHWGRLLWRRRVHPPEAHG